MKGSVYRDTVPANRYAGISHSMMPVRTMLLSDDGAVFCATNIKYIINPPIRYHGYAMWA